MNRKFVLVLFIFSLIYGCSGIHEPDKELRMVDTLLYKELGDSAYKVLRNINVSRLSDEDKVYYNLLNTRVMYLRYMPISSDSTINKCISYYERTEKKEKLAWSYLYKGYILQDLKKYKEAVIYYKKAEEIATNIQEKELEIRIPAALGYLNNITSNHKAAIYYMKKAQKIATQYSNKAWIAYCLNCIGVTFNYLNEMDSARFYIKESIPYTDYMQQIEQPGLLNNQALFYWQNKDLDKAEKLLLKSISIKPTPHAYSLLAELYSTTGKKEQVDSMWAFALQEKDLQTKIGIMKPYSIWLEKKRRSQEAIKVSRQISQMKDSLTRLQQSETIKEVQIDYDWDLEKNKSQNKIIIFISILLMATFAIGVITKQLLKIKKQKRAALTTIEASQQKIDDYAHKVDTLKKAERKKSRKISYLQHKATMQKEGLASRLHKGKVLYEDILKGNTIAKWEKNDFENFTEYYLSTNLPFAKKLENDYTNLSKMYKLILCLMEMGFNNNKICKITNQSSNALSTMKSRINKKKIE